jgi:hypothetical protein
LIYLEINPLQATAGDLICDDNHVVMTVTRITASGDLWTAIDPNIDPSARSWRFSRQDIERFGELSIFDPLRRILKQVDFEPVGTLRVLTERSTHAD